MLVTDPFGKNILFPKGIFIHGANKYSDDAYDDFKTVVEYPACIIETTDGSKFYFRALGWNFNILVEVIKNKNTWQVVYCTLNPGTTFISSLLKKGKFIPGSSID